MSESLSRRVLDAERQGIVHKFDLEALLGGGLGIGCVMSRFVLGTSNRRTENARQQQKAPLVFGTAFNHSSLVAGDLPSNHYKLAAARTSRSRIRPPAPVPVSCLQSMPSSLAMRRARVSGRFAVATR